ncbi:hypothetical protein BCR36DRAFT_414621 [Piromyces finnis]|uniref:Uncharacterized protein n=1 Tax=Piromyces finnis TaxID=1754191 RepID=A0A1Y1V2P8_9FUNG|nr:hypothetical protein BCR36DRAFT_414621 [Piromyces finnis]|eukprot:ORX45159.1 hypothetical protein BCR36DRAFT_414621 [Piromyces finnis]
MDNSISVTNSSNVENIFIKHKNNLEKNEKTEEVKPSISKNTTSENRKFITNDFVDENDFDENEDYIEDDDDDYSDESYEFDEAENAQEAFEAKYYHNRRTSSSNNKSSYTNKISLKKVNTLLAGQNIMVIDKNQLSETINNNSLFSTVPQTLPSQLDISKNDDDVSNQNSYINLAAICKSSSLNSCKSEENESNEINEIVNESTTSLSNDSVEKTKETSEQTLSTSQNDSNDNDDNKAKKNKKSSKKYKNSKPYQFVTEDIEGFIKSKKTKSKKRNETSSKPNSNSDSIDQLNSIQQIESSSQTQQTTTVTNNKSPYQISIDNRKQIHIQYGSNTPIKISDKNIAVIINPTSVNESDIQELLISPSKSHSKNNKPSIPVISSSPYTKNHNKNNHNNNEGSYKPRSPKKSSVEINEITTSPIKNKKNSNNKSSIADSPLFVESCPPLIKTNTYKTMKNNKAYSVNQSSIDYKYSLLDEYNMKKSASPTDDNKYKNRFLKDEFENNTEQQKLSKKERKVSKKLLKNKKLNEEFEALNSTRQTYIVNNGDDEIYQNIFGGQCDPESDNEQSMSKKGHKKNKSINKETTLEETLLIKNKNNKKNKKQLEEEDEKDEEIEIESTIKKQNKRKETKNVKNKNNGNDDGLSRKHTKKSKHQELELIEGNIDDDLFSIAGKPSSAKNNKNKRSARK